MNILCTIGLHKFNTIRIAKYDSCTDEVLGLPSISEQRKCSRCDLTQKLDVHCLGLNPPQYVKTWIKI